MKAFLVTALLATVAAVAQGVTYPKLATQSCSASGCTAEDSTVILDSRWKADPSKYAANGIAVEGDALKLTLKDGNGPRVYLGAGNDKYKMIKMVGKELSYDVETSELTCNMNGALYFVQMPESGGADGTGYCDANGVGGLWCEEMDIWEANQHATAMTVHPTSHDTSGCGYNPYAKGSKNLYGAGSNFQVDTTKPFTVVTQFVASGGSVSEIKRIYVQNGKEIDGGSITSSCNVGTMGNAMKDGSVLAFSIWSSDDLSWLDGGNNGPCPTGTNKKDGTVTFSNIRVGDIGSTTKGGAKLPVNTRTTTDAPATTPTSTSTDAPATTATTSTTAPTSTSTSAPATDATTTAPASTSAAPASTTATPASTPATTKKICKRRFRN